MIQARPAEEIRLLVFDMNAIAYAAAYQPNLAKLSFGGQLTGVIQGTMNSFLATTARYPNALPVALWDGHAAWRKSVNPDYKGNRLDKPEKIEAKEQVKRQTPAIQRMLHALGVAQARHPDAEADDLAGLIASASQRQFVPTRLITPDTDWWQAISPMVDWQSSRDIEQVFFFGGLRPSKDAPPDGWASPQEYLHAKIIAGDSSDHIQGIQGVGLPTAAKILRTSSDGLDGILRGDFSAKGVVADRLRTDESRDLLRRNREIMDWRHAPTHDANQMALYAYPEDLRAFELTAQEFGLNRMAGRIKPGQVKSAAHGAMQSAWKVVVDALNWPEMHAPQVD